MLENASLEKKYIENIITSQQLSSVYLKNGIRLRGHLIQHDKESLLLKGQGGLQLIYKELISAICAEINFMKFDEDGIQFQKR